MLRTSAHRLESILALDLGTTGAKAAVFAVDGALLAAASCEQALSHSEPGHVEQVPDDVWATCISAAREALAAAGSSEVVAISVASQRGTAIGLGADGAPLGNFLVWMDQRGAPLLERVRHVLSASAYYELAGHPLVSYTGISKVLWLSSQAPYRDRVAAIVPPQSWVLRRLGADAVVCDRSTGTFFFPLADDMGWSRDVADGLGISLALLPQLVWGTDVVGELARRPAQELGLRAGTPLVCGGGDGQCAGAGSGTLAPGRVMINIGTAAGVQTYLTSPTRDPQGVLNCGVHVVPDAWELEGHTQASGAALRWFRDRVARHGASYDEVVALAAEAAPGAEGLLFIPTFNGSSAPIVDMRARACLLGLTLAHGLEHISRAVLEGVALEIRWMLDAVRDAGVSTDEIRFVGGAAKSRVWTQIHADALGLPVRAITFADAAATGAAMCAAVGLDLFPDLATAAEAFVDEAEVIEPDPKNREVYDSAYDAYRGVFNALSGVPALAALATVQAPPQEASVD